MTGRNFGTSIMMMGCALFLSGGMALAEDLPHCLRFQPSMQTNICRLEGGRILRLSKTER